MLYEVAGLDWKRMQVEKRSIVNKSEDVVACDR